MSKKMEAFKRSREEGLLNCGRFGMYGGKRLFFTHRKPGFFYTEDLLFSVSDVGKVGRWIPTQKIIFE